MAALDVATTIANCKSMLSGLAAWQSICKVSTSAEAAKRIVEGGTEEPEDAALCPIILLDVTSVPTNWIANRLRGTLTIEIRVELEVPPEYVTFAQQYVWIWQQCSALLAGINGAVGGSGQLMIDRLETPLLPGRKDPNLVNGRNEWGFIISLSVDFM